MSTKPTMKICRLCNKLEPKDPEIEKYEVQYFYCYSCGGFVNRLVKRNITPEEEKRIDEQKAKRLKEGLEAHIRHTENALKYLEEKQTTCISDERDRLYKIKLLEERLEQARK